MKRREFIELNAAALIAGGLSTTMLQNTASAEVSAVDPSTVGKPVLVNPDVNLISVAWRVHQISNGMIEYGKTKELGQTAVAARHGLRLQDDAALLIDLTDLEPNTTYYYRTVTTPLDYVRAKYKHIPNRGKPHRSDIYQFRTPAIKSDTASFSVINDTHGYTSVIHQLFENMLTKPTDAVIWNGDIYDFITPESVTGQTLDVLGPKGFATQTPVVFSCGNHDTRGRYSKDLGKVFSTRNGHRYFTYQNGPIQFMVLDTGEDKSDGHHALLGLTDFSTYRDEQRQWIAKQIERKEWKDAKFRVIVCHIPLYGFESCPDGRKKWSDLLVKGKADLMISGHTHRPVYHRQSGKYPIPLIVGGGPKAGHATIIRGYVKGRQLKLSMDIITGKHVGDWTLNSRQ